jgi:hypothetical protein
MSVFFRRLSKRTRHTHTHTHTRSLIARSRPSPRRRLAQVRHWGNHSRQPVRVRRRMGSTQSDAVTVRFRLFCCASFGRVRRKGLLLVCLVVFLVSGLAPPNLDHPRPLLLWPATPLVLCAFLF